MLIGGYGGGEMFEPPRFFVAAAEMGSAAATFAAKTMVISGRIRRRSMLELSAGVVVFAHF